MRCPNCHNIAEKQGDRCTHCGHSLRDFKKVRQQKDTTQSISNIPDITEIMDMPSQKSKTVAALLGIFLGGFGVHNFYLGFTKRGMIQLFLTIFGAPLFYIGPAIATLWGFLEGVLILMGVIYEDGEGNPLKQ